MKIETRYVDDRIESMAETARVKMLEEHPLITEIKGSISFKDIRCGSKLYESFLSMNDIEFSEDFSYYHKEQREGFFSFQKVSGCIYKLSLTARHNLDFLPHRPFASAISDAYRYRHEILDKLQKELKRYEEYYMLNVEDYYSGLIIRHDLFTVEDYLAIKVTVPVKELVVA
jgi:hypothetical protein